jgi:hypothetical protein
LLNNLPIISYSNLEALAAISIPSPLTQPNHLGVVTISIA